MNKDQIEMAYRESEVSSLAEFIQATKKTLLPLFRGQTEDEDLMPSLGRLFVENEYGGWGFGVDELEKEMMTAFKQHGATHLARNINTELELLLAAQTYGLPTRLLAWSKNPLKALFFAVEDIRNKNNGVVYGMEPFIDMWIEDVAKVDLDDRYLVTFDPLHINNRLIAHESCFTLFPFWHWEVEDENEEDNFRPITKNSPYKEIHILHKIVISGEAKIEIFKELLTIGISHRSMFPDLDGICKSLIIEKTLGSNSADFFPSIGAQE